MGFFDRLRSGQQKFPALDPQSESFRRFNELGDQVGTIVREVPDPLEVVMGDHGTAVVFIGKPPKRFGVMLIENNQVKNLKDMATEKGLSPEKMSALIDQMRKAYERHMDEGRFSTQVADRQVVVHPSEQFENEMEQILQTVSH